MYIWYLLYLFIGCSFRDHLRLFSFLKTTSPASSAMASALISHHLTKASASSAFAGQPASETKLAITTKQTVRQGVCSVCMLQTHMHTVRTWLLSRSQPTSGAQSSAAGAKPKQTEMRANLPPKQCQWRARTNFRLTN